jgi:hypothetical protein
MGRSFAERGFHDDTIPVCPSRNTLFSFAPEWKFDTPLKKDDSLIPLLNKDRPLVACKYCCCPNEHCNMHYLLISAHLGPPM